APRLAARMAKASESTETSLAERVVAGEGRALARAISLVENRDPEGDRLVAELFPRPGRARILRLTGPPGVGKSTLIGSPHPEPPRADAMVREIRSVLAIGPERAWKVPVVRTEATKGDGIEQLVAKVDEHRAHIEAEGSLAERRARNLRAEVIGIAAARLRRDL